MRAPNPIQQLGEVRHCFRAQPQLPRARPPLAADRRRFEPDQLGPARREALVTAPGQIARPSVRSGVAALHGVNRDRVADGVVPHALLAGEKRLHPFRIALQSDVRRPQLVSAPRQLV